VGEREATRSRRDGRLSPSTHTVLDLDDPRGVPISPGFTGYERWIEWLREAVNPGSLHSGTMILHEDMCLRLKEMRSLAAEYLRASPVSREKMAQALELCLEDERAAIGEIEAALASGKDA